MNLAKIAHRPIHPHVVGLVIAPLLSAIFFGIVGPPAGSLVPSVAALVTAMAADGEVDGAGAIVFAAFFSYLIGFKPAVITGLLVGPFAGRIRRSRFVLLCAFVGALVCLAFAFSHNMGGINSSSAVSWSTSKGLLLIVVGPGFLGGLLGGWVLAALVDWRRRQNGNLPFECQ